MICRLSVSDLQLTISDLQLTRRAFIDTSLEPFPNRTIVAEHRRAELVGKEKKSGGCEALIDGNSSPFTTANCHERGRNDSPWDALPRDCFGNRSKIDDLRRVRSEFLANGVQATDQVKRDVLVLNEMLNWLVEVAIASR